MTNENFKVTLRIKKVPTPNFQNNDFFYSVRRLILMYHLSDAGAAHTAKSLLYQIGHFARQCEFEIGSFWLNSHKTRMDSTRKKRFMRVEASQSYAKPRKALLRPAVQWRLCLTVPVSAQRRFLCAAFSKLPKDPGIPCENTVYLTSTSRGVRCGGACAATKTSRNP